MTKRNFFEAQPARNLDTFGVAGVLNEGARIYYSNVFAPAQIGRVSDLLMARLKDSQVDELRFRALLLYGVFEAYVAAIQSPQADSGAVQVSVECGVDGEKIAVGVSFSISELSTLGLGQLPDRLTAVQHKNDFDSLVAFLSQHSDHVIIRHQTEKGRIEIVTVLGLGVAEVFANGPCAVQVLEIPETATGNPVPPLSPNEYVELGDLNYKALLADPSIPVTAAAADNAPIRVISGSDDGLTRTLVKGSSEAPVATSVVKGTAAEGHDSSSTFKSDSTALADAIRVRGAAAAQSEESVRISSAKPHAENQLIVQGYVDKITELEMKLKSLETGGGVPAGAFAGKLSSRAAVTAKVPRESFLKKFWPFKKATENESVEFENVPETTNSVNEEAVTEGEDSDSALDDKMPESVVSKLVGELTEKALTGTLAKAQQEIVEVKKDISNDKAKRWVESLMSDFLQEKVRLNELAKKLGTSVRQKEHEFRSKERAFQEELRRRDEVIRQKVSAANRAKDQLAQVNMALERLKGTSTGGGGDEVNLKAKFSQTQKYLTTAKQENALLLTKLEDLKNQLNSAQTKARPAPEQTALQLKLDRAQKQADEFKKTNLQLLDKLNQTKDRSVDAESLELKKRLESTLRVAASAKKESERLGTRLEEVQKEELRLKTEVAKMTAENKRLKVTLAKNEKPTAEEPVKKDPKAA